MSVFYIPHSPLSRDQPDTNPKVIALSAHDALIIPDLGVSVYLPGEEWYALVISYGIMRNCFTRRYWLQAVRMFTNLTHR